MAGPRTREGLIEAIYKMVGDQTWNVLSTVGVLGEEKP